VCRNKGEGLLSLKVLSEVFCSPELIEGTGYEAQQTSTNKDAKI